MLLEVVQHINKLAGLALEGSGVPYLPPVPKAGLKKHCVSVSVCVSLYVCDKA